MQPAPSNHCKAPLSDGDKAGPGNGYGLGVDVVAGEAGLISREEADGLAGERWRP
jgi:hypothetical protein